MNKLKDVLQGNRFIFQRDNATVHTAKVVKSYFAANNIPLLEWPARSPDMNIIENLWGDVARVVYASSVTSK